MSNLCTSLEKQKLPGINKIKKLPGADKLITKKGGTLFVVKYFLNTSKGPRMIGMSSKDKSFKNLYGVILYDLKLQPAVTFVIKPSMEDKKLLDFIGKIVSKSKYKIPKRKIRKEDIESEVKNYIQEVGAINMPSNTGSGAMDKIFAGVSILYGIFLAIIVILSVWGFIESVWNWFTERYSKPCEKT